MREHTAFLAMSGVVKGHGAWWQSASAIYIYIHMWITHSCACFACKIRVQAAKHFDEQSNSSCRPYRLALLMDGQFHLSGWHGKASACLGDAPKRKENWQAMKSYNLCYTMPAFARSHWRQFDSFHRKTGHPCRGTTATGCKAPTNWLEWQGTSCDCMCPMAISIQ